MKRSRPGIRYIQILTLGLCAAALSQWLLESSRPTVAMYLGPDVPSANDQVQSELRKLRQTMIQQARDNAVQANPAFMTPRQ